MLTTLRPPLKATPFHQVSGPLFPAVGLHSQGEEVELILRPHVRTMPFRFDVEAHRRTQVSAWRASLLRHRVPSVCMLRLVQQHLLAHGYAGTLGALEEESGTKTHVQVTPGEAGDDVHAPAATTAMAETLRLRGGAPASPSSAAAATPLTRPLPRGALAGDAVPPLGRAGAAV